MRALALRESGSTHPCTFSCTQTPVFVGCIVALTGITDWVSDGYSVVRLSNGHKLLGEITGSGCMVRKNVFKRYDVKEFFRSALQWPRFVVQ